MKKKPANVQNDPRKSTGGISYTGYLLKSLLMPKKRLSSQSEKMVDNYPTKTYISTNLETEACKISGFFMKNKELRTQLSMSSVTGGRNPGKTVLWNHGTTELRAAEYYAPSLFLRKGGRQ